jgi:hypothetical protein
LDDLISVPVVWEWISLELSLTYFYLLLVCCTCSDVFQWWWWKRMNSKVSIELETGEYKLQKICDCQILFCLVAFELFVKQNGK